MTSLLRKRGRWLVLTVCALAALALAAGCGGSSDSDSGTTSAEPTTAADTAAPADTGAPATAPAEEAEPLTLAYLASATLNQFSAAMIEELTGLTDADGSELEVFDPNFDPQKQLTQCQDVVASGQYNAIIVQPIDQVGIVPCIEDAIAAGILVATSENPIGPRGDTSEPQVEGLVGSVFTPYTSDGQAAADLIVQACGDLDPCKVAYYFGFRNFAYDAGRYEVMTGLLAEHPNIELVYEAETKFDVDEGYKATQDLLSAHPDVNVIAANGDHAATGALNALTDAAVEGVAVIGAGASVEGVEAVRDGSFFGTTVLTPRSSIAKAYEMIVQANAGETIEKRGWSDQLELSPVGAYLTGENANEFEGEWSFTGRETSR